jgi:hypothetical protein
MSNHFTPCLPSEVPMAPGCVVRLVDRIGSQAETEVWACTFWHRGLAYQACFYGRQPSLDWLVKVFVLCPGKFSPVATA